MLYYSIKEAVDVMVEEMMAGKEECQSVLSFKLTHDQSVPVTVTTKLIYPLNQIKVILFCPILLVEPDVSFEEIYRDGAEDDEFRLMRLIARFTTTLERTKTWIEKEIPEMIRWGEGVVFDKNGRTKRIPFAGTSPAAKTGKQKILK